MDPLDLSADGFMSNDRFLQWLRRLEEQVEDTRAPLLCAACKGSGMCLRCAGNGRYLVRGRGLFACTVCIGDGACTTCQGTGQALHA
jgi:hypothetical protein